MALDNVLVWCRRYDQALTALHRSVELDHNYAQGHALLGMALTYCGRPCLTDRIARNPNTDGSRMLLAACYGHLGRIDEARAAWAGLLEVNPGFSLAEREGVLPYKNAGDFQRILDGRAKAGVG